MHMLQFANPQVLWLAVPAVLLLFHLWGSCKFRCAPAALGILLLGLVMYAGPHHVTNVKTATYSGHVVVGLADDSGSMSRCLDPWKGNPCVTTYDDMAIGFDKFTRLRQTDVVAVTLFSDTPLVVTDPAQGRKQTLTAFAQAKPRYQGTDAGAASIRAAIAQFKNAPDGARVLVIMTDGEFELTASDRDEIARQLKELNVSVHWILPDWDRAGPYNRDLYKLMQLVAGRIYEVNGSGDIGDAFLKIALVEDPRLEAQEKSVKTDLTWYFAIPLVICILCLCAALCACKGGCGAGEKKRLPKGRDTVFDVGDGKVVIVRDTTRP